MSLRTQLATLATLLLASLASAQVPNLVQVHQGQTDPATEGFTLNAGPGVFGPAQHQGGIGPVNVNGTDAWRVYDVVVAPSNATNFSSYEWVVGPYVGANATQTNAKNWLMSAYVDPAPAAGSSPTCTTCSGWPIYNSSFTVRSHAQTFSNGTTAGYAYWVGVEELPDGTNRVHWELTTSNVYMRNAIVPGGFIWVELFYRTATNKARLFVNGIELDSDVTPAYYSQLDNRITFGDHAYVSSSFGGADWATVRFERGNEGIDLQGASCGRVSYCPPTANSFSPTGAQISIAGSTSLSTGGLMSLTGTGIPPNKSGTLAYGLVQASIPFGAGTLCVQQPKRLQVVNSTAIGSINYTLSITNPAYGFTPGSTWNFQYIFRDPIAGGTSLNTSSALAVTFCP
jgi:hypothetical protein